MADLNLSQHMLGINMLCIHYLQAITVDGLNASATQKLRKATSPHNDSTPHIVSKPMTTL